MIPLDYLGRSCVIRRGPRCERGSRKISIRCDGESGVKVVRLLPLDCREKATAEDGRQCGAQETNSALSDPRVTQFCPHFNFI